MLIKKQLFTRCYRFIMSQHSYIFRDLKLEVWRCKHRGPKYAKLGSRILYDPDDLDDYFAARSISTRDTEFDRTGARK